ncbi:MAG: amidohydrolase family protein [Bacteroidota bacterium]
MRIIITSIFSILILFLTGCSIPVKYDIVINNVGVFDGETDRGIVNIGIRNDSIISITKEILSGDSLIDGTSKYIIPGMINGHVHASNLEQLQEGYKYGILANLNMHTGLENREAQWKKMSQDSVGFPFLYGSGHAATVPDGHPNQFSPDMETINDSISIEQWVDNRIANGVDYIKIVRDGHPWLSYPLQPTLEYEQIGEIIRYSKSKGYKTVIHAITMEDMLAIAKFKPDGFVHMMERTMEHPISDESFKELAESNVFIIPNAALWLKSKEGMPPFMKEWIGEHIFTQEQCANYIKKIHDSGITIIAGTDAQSGQLNFGSDFLLELEMYKRAGLSNLEILKTTTGNTAKAFDIPVGLITEGSKPNMLLLSGNPIKDLKHLQEIEKIWKNGNTE